MSGPIPTGHPDYEIVPENGGYAIIHKTNADHGGMGAIRHADTLEDAKGILKDLMISNGDA